MMLRILAKFLARPTVTKWLVKQAKKRPYIHIPADTGDYMERYWLIPESWNLPFAVRIHIIKAADRDRHLHDHPFDFRTFVLDGMYIEERADGKAYRKETDTYKLDATTPHRIRAVFPLNYSGVVSMFILGKRKQVWGFYTDEGKIPYTEYLDAEKIDSN